MYESYYGLTANPFRLVPDARFFYEGTGHRRGLAYLRYGLLQGQGFVVITGKPGTGKSSLVQMLLTDISNHSLVVSSIASTNLEADELLLAVGHSFGISGSSENKAALLIEIEKFLKAVAKKGKRAVLIVDEAHNLPQMSLEELRMLSNFQQGERSLLQIMLLGQHQLNEILARPDMEQLSQRVIASCDLKPLSAEQMRGYISYRLQCGGWHGDPSISSEALALIYAVSSGVPRLINIFCDRLFLSASLEDKHDIDLALAQSVLDDLKDESTGSFCGVNFHKNKNLVELEPLTSVDIAAPAAQDNIDDEAVKDNPTTTADSTHEVAEQAPQANQQTDILATEFTANKSGKLDEAVELKYPEAKLDFDPEKGGGQDEPLSTETDQSTSPQQDIEPTLIEPDAVQVTPTTANEESKSDNAPNTTVKQRFQNNAAAKTLFQDYPAQPVQYSELNNDRLVLPILFVGVAMILLPFFIEDIIEFSQSFSFDNSFTYHVNETNTQDNQSVMAELSEPESEVDHTVFIANPVSSESQYAVQSLSETGMDEMQAGSSNELDTGEETVSELDTKLDEKVDPTSQRLSDAAPLVVATMPAEVESEPKKQMANNQAPSTESTKSTPAPAEINVVTPTVAKLAQTTKHEPKGQIASNQATTNKSAKPVSPQAEMSNATPTVAKFTPQAKPESVKQKATKEGSPEQPAKKASLHIESKTIAPVRADNSHVAPVPIKSRLAVADLEKDETKAEVIAPTFDDPAAIDVVAVIAISDDVTNSAAVVNSRDLPPVFKVELDDKARITKQELKNLLHELISYYESGDLSGFVGLFASDAVADGTKGVDRIRKDYLALFDMTDRRKMEIEELQWKYMPGRVSGNGEFSVTVRRKNRRQSILQQGTLNLAVVKHGDTLAIKSMSHELK